MVVPSQSFGLGFFLVLMLCKRHHTIIADAQQVGDTICVEGFIMDHYCLYDTGGTLLDTGDVTLEFPFRHTIHCLVDVRVCQNGPYYILGDPTGDGSQLYTVDYILDDNGRLLLIDSARQAGSMGSGCQTCLGDDDGLERGYRAEVMGVVTALATDDTPTLLTVTSARTSNMLTAVCTGVTTTTTTTKPSPIVTTRLPTTRRPVSNPSPITSFVTPTTAPVEIVAVPTTPETPITPPTKSPNTDSPFRNTEIPIPVDRPTMGPTPSRTMPSVSPTVSSAITTNKSSQRPSVVTTLNETSPVTGVILSSPAAPSVVPVIVTPRPIGPSTISGADTIVGSVVLLSYTIIMAAAFLVIGSETW